MRPEMTDAGPVGEQELRKRDLHEDWLQQLRAWLADADAAGIAEPTAMVLATADGGGRPGARTVLMKGLDERGLVFYSHRDSRKGRDLEANPRAAVVFPWYAMRRQVIVEGSVSLLDDDASDEYFAGRPYRSRIGALASRQSRVIPGREVLEDARDQLERRYPETGPVPRPQTWGGWLIAPASVEFWQGRRDRLHDRLRYRREGDGWVVERLSP
jgi:pyridoxamine 5'-phosphate oxidase